MIVRSLLICVGCFVSVISFGQQSSISISVGGSFPMGDFASTSIYNSKSGYAQFGQHLQVAYQVPLENQFQFLIKLKGQRNPLNTDEIGKQLINITNVPDWKFENASYYMGALMAGFGKSIPLNNSGKTYFTPNAFVGLMYAHSPKLKAESKLPNSYAVLDQNSASALAPAFSVGGNFNFSLSKNIDLVFELEYFGTTTVKFKDIRTDVGATSGGLVVPGLYTLSNSKNPPVYSSSTSNVTTRFSGVNVLAGISIKL